jgi:CTP:phosphocholine cytidylyltransferase-like protein
MADLIKADNAVILAAGFSSRFVPVCIDMPKGLLRVNGDTLIERQIKQLREIGIKNIFVITGAHAQKFQFLKEKHGVDLIFNPDYSTKNNFASVYAARSVLGNTIITSSDLYFPKNIFQPAAVDSYYASVFSKCKTTERTLTLDKNDYITATKYGGRNTWITFGGQAFFTYKFSQTLIAKMADVYDRPEYANKYWVDFQDADLRGLPMRIKRLERGDIIEFNTLESLWKFDPYFNAAAQSKTMGIILNKLNIKNERELSDIRPIKKNNEAIGCNFTLAGKTYEYIAKTSELKGAR